MCVLILIKVQHIWLTNRWYSQFSQINFRVPSHSTRSNSFLNSYFLISLFHYYYFFCVSYTPYSPYDECREGTPKLS